MCVQLITAVTRSPSSSTRSGRGGHPFELEEGQAEKSMDNRKILTRKKSNLLGSTALLVPAMFVNQFLTRRAKLRVSLAYSIGKS